MNINTLVDAALNNYLLQDGIWQKADFYDLNTSSTFWNRAVIITLPNTSAQTPELALIYLLQKESRALGIWEKAWDDAAPTIHDFINFVLAEKRFTNTEGRKITIESFWDKYNDTIAGITTEPDFECSLNDIAIPFIDLLNKAAIIQVTCFDDTWNEQNFFVETETAWVLFHWESAT